MAEFLRQPVLHRRVGGQVIHGKRKDVGRGVVAGEVDDEDVAVDFSLGQALALLGIQRRLGQRRQERAAGAGVRPALCDPALLRFVHVRHGLLEGRDGLAELSPFGRQPRRIGEEFGSHDDEEDAVFQNQLERVLVAGCGIGMRSLLVALEFERLAEAGFGKHAERQGAKVVRRAPDRWAR
ncbi:hypothetical protein Trco_002119 [Trichoderma cornu-damae]|uniref:Uncharacterized protein n=1 Tax=Trichoderma cornu-damae TaxID=654480 RepID=A0A9P8QU22_9HYPO|nr:hypothetical protein Trco_002119 [Trichoderma cornu-damae]